MRRSILLAVLPGALILTALVSLAEPASSTPAPAFTAFTHTGVVSPRGLAAQGRYVWITDVGKVGRGARVVRIDATTGATRDITRPFISLPFEVVASRRYAWVMNNTLGKSQQWSLLRINAATMAVSRVKLPAAAPVGLGYVGNPIFLADHYVWIPCARGIIRVSTTTLVATKITSTLILGSPVDVVADAHHLWMNAPTYYGPNQKFLVRVSVDTGAVTKVIFPGVGGGFPIGDDGTNIWVMNGRGIQRINTATGRATTIAVPADPQISIPETGPSAVANGGIYFCAGLAGPHHSGLVRIGISSGLATLVSSPLIYGPSFVTAANGVVWVVNTPPGYLALPVRQPILVRVSWPSPG